MLVGDGYGGLYGFASLAQILEGRMCAALNREAFGVFDPRHLPPSSAGGGEIIAAPLPFVKFGVVIAQVQRHFKGAADVCVNNRQVGLWRNVLVKGDGFAVWLEFCGLVFVQDFGDSGKSQGIKNNFGGGTMVGVAVEIVPCDDRIGLKFGVEPCELQGFVSRPLHFGIAHVKKLVTCTDFFGDVFAVGFSFFLDFCGWGIAELGSEFAIGCPDQFDGVASSRVLGECAKAGNFVVGVGKDGEDVHGENITKNPSRGEPRGVDSYGIPMA
jgi:hypothetical protein